MNQTHPATARTRRHPLVAWWQRCIVETVDHRAVIEKVQAEAEWSARFAFMIMMSAGIAVLGLLLSSPAVVIGAMLISPLMGPIIGFGFGLALFDSADIRRTTITIAAGVVMAVLFCALIVAMSPLDYLGAQVVQKLGVHVVAEAPISVYGLNRRYQTTDTWASIPVHLLGTGYRAVGYGWLESDLLSQIAVVATEDNTVVTIVP